MSKLPCARISKSTIVVIAIIASIAFFAFNKFLYESNRVFPIPRRNVILPKGKLHSSRDECIEPSTDVEALNQVLNARISKSKPPLTPRKKLVLLWTTHFGVKYTKRYYFFQPGNSTFSHYKCAVDECAVTSNRSLITEADGVLFRINDFDFNDLPEHRTANQTWIFYNLEAPPTIRKDWKRMNDLFNWSMSYREDSDIIVKYGEACRIRESKEHSHMRNYLQNKSKEVAWLVSNCRVSSNRWKYVEELSKYISVDIYGACGTMSCTPVRSSHCYQKISDNYKFYLSFENSICRDYITEKLFNILRYDIVPVVMGGGDYYRIAPPNSYIDAFDFTSPEKLAEFLKKVGRSDNLYNSYFDWKGKYKVYLVPWMCDLCEKLHTMKYGESKLLRNVRDWWLEMAHCMVWYEGNVARKWKE